VVTARAESVNGKLCTILLKYLRRDMEAKVDAEKELDLETINLWHQHTSDLGVICVVVVSIIEELRCQHHGCYDNAVDVKFRQKKVVSLDEAVDVYQSKHKAFFRATCILVNTVENEGQWKREREEKTCRRMPVIMYVFAQGIIMQ